MCIIERDEKVVIIDQTKRIAELESQILRQTAISACRIEERERLQAQIAALQEIAIEQKAAHIAFFGFHRNMNEDETKNKAPEEARRQLATEHPEAFR